MCDAKWDREKDGKGKGCVHLQDYLSYLSGQIMCELLIIISPSIFTDGKLIFVLIVFQFLYQTYKFYTLFIIALNRLKM